MHPIRQKTKAGLVIALLAFAPFAQAQDQDQNEDQGRWTLTAADWSRPRSGEAVIAMQPVAAAVRAWHAAGADARLLLVHAGGEEGSLWAAELRDWLVALGLPPAAVLLTPGGQPGDRLELRLEQTP